MEVGGYFWFCREYSKEGRKNPKIRKNKYVFDKAFVTVKK
jgi:hypothetical protein